MCQWCVNEVYVCYNTRTWCATICKSDMALRDVIKQQQMMCNNPYVWWKDVTSVSKVVQHCSNTVECVTTLVQQCTHMCKYVTIQPDDFATMVNAVSPTCNSVTLC